MHYTQHYIYILFFNQNWKFGDNLLKKHYIYHIVIINNQITYQEISDKLR